jgi:hypothetical protein
MKPSHFPFSDKTNPAVERPCAFEETDATPDAEGRRWPKLTVPHTRVSEMANTIKDQSAELILRHTQIADLCNLRQQQANEILIACDEIDRLSKYIC